MFENYTTFNTTQATNSSGESDFTVSQGSNVLPSESSSHRDTGHDPTTNPGSRNISASTCNNTNSSRTDGSSTRNLSAESTSGVARGHHGAINSGNNAPPTTVPVEAVDLAQETGNNDDEEDDTPVDPEDELMTRATAMEKGLCIFAKPNTHFWNTFFSNKNSPTWKNCGIFDARAMNKMFRKIAPYDTEHFKQHERFVGEDDKTGLKLIKDKLSAIVPEDGEKGKLTPPAEILEWNKKLAHGLVVCKFCFNDKNVSLFTAIQAPQNGAVSNIRRHMRTHHAEEMEKVEKANGSPAGGTIATALAAMGSHQKTSKSKRTDSIESFPLISQKQQTAQDTSTAVSDIQNPTKKTKLVGNRESSSDQKIPVVSPTKFMVEMASLREVRLHRIESTVGVLPRIHFLEQTFGLPEENGMTIGERLTRLEKLLE